MVCSRATIENSWRARSVIKTLLQVEAPPREVLETLANERNPLYEEIADVTIRTDGPALGCGKPDYSYAGSN